MMKNKKADSGVSFWLVAGILAAFVLVIVVVGLYFFGGSPIKFFSWLGFDGNKTETIEGIEIFRYDITTSKIQYYDGTTFTNFNPGESLRLNNKEIKSDILKNDFENWYYKTREKTISLPKTYTLEDFYGLIKDTSKNPLPQADIKSLLSKSINEMWCAGPDTALSTSNSDDGISLIRKNILFSLDGLFTEPIDYPNYIKLNSRKTDIYIASELIKIGGKAQGYLEKTDCEYKLKLYDSERESINSAFGGDENYFDALNMAIIKGTRIILSKSVSAAALKESKKKINKDELKITNVKISEMNIKGIKSMLIDLIDDKSNIKILNAGYFTLKLNDDFYFNYKIISQGKEEKKSIKILYKNIEDISNIYNETKVWKDALLSTEPLPITIFSPSPEVKPKSPIYVCAIFKDNKYIVADLANKPKENNIC